MLELLIETFFYSVTFVSFILAINYFLTNRSLNVTISNVVSKVGMDQSPTKLEGTSKGERTTDLSFGDDSATNKSFNHLPSLPVAGSFPHDNKDLTIHYSNSQLGQIYRN